MDILGLWIPDVILWLVLILGAIYIYGTRNFCLGSYGYKGPRPYPLYGNLFMILPGKKHFAACDPMLKKKYGKMVAIYLGSKPEILTFDPEVIKHVLVKDFANFTDRRKNRFRGILKYSLLDLGGHDWRRVRGLTSPFFTVSKMRHHMVHLEETVDNLVSAADKYLDKDGKCPQPIDAKRLCGKFTMESILRTAFGVSGDVIGTENSPVMDAAYKALEFKIGGLVLLGITFPFLIPLLEWAGVTMLNKKAMDSLEQVVLSTIEARQKSDKEYPDFLQACLKAHEEELNRDAHEAMSEHLDPNNRGKGLTKDEIVAQAVVFLMAGYETTSTALSILLLNLAIHPAWQQRVVDEINDVIGDEVVTYDSIKRLTILDMCLDESQRLYPSAFRIDRVAAEETTICGHVIPKGCVVGIPVLALHRDPELWEDPDSFDPERFSPDKKKDVLNSYKYFPFGVGPRACVGMRLAVVEVKMAAIKLLQKYTWTVDEKTKLPIEFDAKILSAVKGGNWLNIERRQ